MRRGERDRERLAHRGDERHLLRQFHEVRVILREIGIAHGSAPGPREKAAQHLAAIFRRAFIGSGEKNAPMIRRRPLRVVIADELDGLDDEAREIGIELMLLGLLLSRRDLWRQLDLTIIKDVY